MLININENKIFQEVYFGKTPEILALENQLDKFRSRYVGSYPLGTYSISGDPELLKFNRMLENQFGFGCVSINIVGNMMENMFTLPIDMRFDVFNSNKKLIANKSTFKFNKNADYTCIINIFTGLIFNPNYSSAEIMALILHEIGHNFYAAINDHACLIKLYAALKIASDVYEKIVPTLLMSNAIKRIPLVGEPLADNMKKNVTQNAIGTIVGDALGQQNWFQKILVILGDFIREKTVLLNLLFDIINTLRSTATIIGQAIYSFNNLISLGNLQILSSIMAKGTALVNPFTYITLPIAYGNERSADNFVTMYGYAGELSSALQKMSSKKESPSKMLEVFNKIPIISNIYALNCSSADIILSIFDEHPTELSRCHDQIMMLKRELAKSDLDPKMKKVISSDIEACEKQIKILTDTSLSIENKDILRNAWYKLLYDHFNSKTFKDLLDNKKKFDIYDKTYTDKFTT